MATKLMYHQGVDVGPLGLERWVRDDRRLTPVGVGSIAQGNRHTRRPHEHKREIARNMARTAARG